jgi:hypothetical protein
MKRTPIVSSLALLLCIGGAAHAQLSLDVVDPEHSGVVALGPGGVQFVPISQTPTVALTEVEANGQVVSSATATFDALGNANGVDTHELSLSVQVPANANYADVCSVENDQTNMNTILFKIDSGGTYKTGDPVYLTVTPYGPQPIAGANFHFSLDVNDVKNPAQSYVFNTHLVNGLDRQYEVGDTVLLGASLGVPSTTGAVAAAVDLLFGVHAGVGGPPAVPEPGSLALFGAACLCGLPLAWRRRSR